jgi:hydroxyacid-oxoacid transhydrogenase
MSVILSAPAVARFTAPAAPEKHRQITALLGGEGGGPDGEVGDALAAALRELMAATAMPADLRALGYGERDVAALVEGTFAQQRLLANAPRPVAREDLAGLFTDALRGVT